MDLNLFAERIRHHAAHVSVVADHCKGEETTKQALILPLLDILGFSPYDPLIVKAEYYADVPGVKRSEKVDYALYSEGEPVMFIEAKAVGESLGTHAPQLARYFNATPGVCVVALTNGLKWKFFTDLENKNMMDSKPFFSVDFTELKETDIPELSRFCYGTIRADHLRTFAEDQANLAKLKEVITSSLRELDDDFVKYVISKALPTIRLTQKLIESYTPLVKRAVAEAMSGMVVNSLNTPTHIPITEEVFSENDNEGDQVDPNNPNIITTREERRFFEVVKDVLKGYIPEEDIIAKDTENYYAILFQGKNNRWLLRYRVNRKRPTVEFAIELTEQHQAEIARVGLEIAPANSVFLDSPEQIMRLAGLVFDSLAHCANDNNFKRATVEV